MSALVVIPARKGSKRFPGKNQKHVDGPSMVARAIMAAREAGKLVIDIVVSTDDSVVARQAEMMGVKSIGRPRELATDTAAIDDVARWAYREWYENGCGHPLDDNNLPPHIVCIIQPNCPVWKPGTIREMLAIMLVEDDLTGCMSAHPVREQPYWMLEEDEEGYAQFHIDGPEPRPFRAQDMKPAYRADGQVVAVDVGTLFATEGRSGAYRYLGDRIKLFKREAIYGIDVDEPFDLEVATAAVRWLKSDGEGN